MKAAENQFLPFLDGKKQFVIPIYQRTYSWTHEQCGQLWNDIVQATTYARSEGHFIGSIVYVQQDTLIGGIPQYLVIDGQQRLTTLSLLLVALAHAIQEGSIAQDISHDEIYDSYLVNVHGKGEKRYKLLLTQSDKEDLIEIVDHPERVTTAQGVSHLIDNYNFFAERIRQSNISLQMLYEGISRLIIVEIMLGRDDNPQLIFESLNSTGMDLSQADLIRNYVLMGLKAEEQERLYKDYWYRMERDFRYAEGTEQFDRFMRDYLTMKQGVIPNIDRVYVSFKSYHRSKAETTIKEIVEDVYRYASYYLKVALLQEKDDEIWGALNDINTLKVDVAYPFLLEVYDDYVQKLLVKKDLLAILRLVESYVLRRLISGIPPNALNRVFATLGREINKEQYLESVQAAFLSKSRSARFPRDEEFRLAFVVKDVYNLRIRKYLLSRLENYDEKELVNVESCTIEHIMPQNEHLSAEWQAELGPNWQEIQARYLHTIGNLTLTGYNSVLSDRPFLEKRDMEGGFADSPIRLNRGPGKLEHWNKDEIEKRAEVLVNLAMKIWTMPTLSSEQLHKYDKESVLAEVIGPTTHPVAGFVPADFKIVQVGERKFHYYRLVNGEWVQYGNGKTPWYALSWENVGRWVRGSDEGGAMPLGAGGEMVSSVVNTKAGNTGVQVQYSNLDNANGKNGYTVDSYQYLQGNLRDLFERLRERILNLDTIVREEYKKWYIAYKLSTNFVNIEPQKKRLKIFLTMRFNEIIDPKGLCRDLTNIGHAGVGDVEIGATSPDQLDDIMYLIRQSFEKHWEEDDA